MRHGRRVVPNLQVLHTQLVLDLANDRHQVLHRGLHSGRLRLRHRRNIPPVGGNLHVILNRLRLLFLVVHNPDHLGEALKVKLPEPAELGRWNWDPEEGHMVLLDRVLGLLLNSSIVTASWSLLQKAMREVARKVVCGRNQKRQTLGTFPLVVPPVQTDQLARVPAADDGTCLYNKNGTFN